MKSWKSTLFGFVTAAGVGMAQSSDPTVHGVGLLLSIVGPLMLGFFAKDKNVTGGTIQQ